MDFNEYQELANRTAASYDQSDLQLTVFTLGLIGEAGEVAEHVKKVVGHGHQLDINHMKKELGDVLWYLAVTAKFLGIDLQDIAEANIAKLKARYPEGFSSEASINRVA
jgi:NTP pyrophosphatase (non-canonical NTP hydrolase)